MKFSILSDSKISDKKIQFFGLAILSIALISTIDALNIPELLFDVILGFLTCAMIVLFVIVERSDSNRKIIGELNLGDDCLLIDYCNDKVAFKKNEVVMKFSESGWNGMPNYKLFTTLGALTNHNGINSFEINNDYNKIKLIVLIKTQNEFDFIRNYVAK